MTRLGRNNPCWCGSGRKFKRCHWPQRGPDEGLQEKVTAEYGPWGKSVIEQALQQNPKKDVQLLLTKIEREKQTGKRVLPSSNLISIGDTPAITDRVFLVDACARLVDQNWAGRSEMCVQFAVLLRHGLGLSGYQAVVEVGKACYSMAGEIFEWDHAWVRTELGDIVDGNVDSMVENPMVPVGIEPKPYWGPSEYLPSDRELKKMRDLPPERDEIELVAGEIGKWKTLLEGKIKERQADSKVS